MCWIIANRFSRTLNAILDSQLFWFKIFVFFTPHFSHTNNFLFVCHKLYYTLLVKNCEVYRYLTALFLVIRFCVVLSSLVFSRRTYFDHQYMGNDYETVGLIQIITSALFLWNGNWYCGLWAILQSWFSIPKYLIR